MSQPGISGRVVSRLLFLIPKGNVGDEGGGGGEGSETDASEGSAGAILELERRGLKYERIEPRLGGSGSETSGGRGDDRIAGVASSSFLFLAGGGASISLLWADRFP